LVAADELAAKDAGVRSIVFPILGAGVAGADVEPTVRTMVDAAVAYLDATAHPALRAIYLLAYTQVELAALERAVTATPGLVATPA
jgi:O-acetyl-ADP-ribose deacetylase (regulator of RNase III)